MDYERIYQQLIENRQSEKPKGYVENHHIIPRCLGGTDDESNLVVLTAREHYIAHLLLTKIHPKGMNHYKVAHAFLMMLVSSRNQNRINGRRYEKLKKSGAKLISVKQKGNGNSQHGTCWIWHELIGSKKVNSDLLSEYMEQGWYKGRNLKFEKMVPVEVRRRERNRKMSESRTGRKHTEEAKQKMRGTKPKIRCPHCGKTGAANVMSRWHFENCKARLVKSESHQSCNLE